MRSFYLLFSVIIVSLLLRFYQLGTNPPALYWDEASLGYNAYSILKTAKDEHGKIFPLISFAAFGDYKPPLYIYLTVPSIALFSLSEFSIRFPSAFFALLTVIFTYLLAKMIFNREKPALLTAFFLAISPWHVQFSRAAFEANVGLFFSLGAIYFFVKYTQDKKVFIFLSLLFFSAAMYTFTGQRLFVPFILLILILISYKEILKNLRTFIPALIVFLILFYPIYSFSTKTIEGKLRFDEVTIFKDLDPINKSVDYQKEDNNSPLSKIIHNRRAFFIKAYIEHYFDAFNPNFLFSKGDKNPRLSIQDIGQLYYFDLPLFIIGSYFLVKNKNKYSFLIFGWLLISPLGPATARETPHSLRMVHILPTFQLISAYGLIELLKRIKWHKLFSYLLMPIVFLSVFYYLHQYYFHYPKTYSGEWQYGYKQAVEAVLKRYDDFDRIYVTEKLGRPYIYFLLYSNYSPDKYQEISRVERDNFYFYHVLSFDKYIFTNDIPQNPPPKSLLIAPPDTLPSQTDKITTIYDLGNQPVFDIGKK